MSEWTTLRDGRSPGRALPSQLLGTIQQRLREENLLEVAYRDGVLEFEGRPLRASRMMGGAINLISLGRIDVDRAADCVRYQLSLRVLNAYFGLILGLIWAGNLAVAVAGRHASPLAALVVPPAIFVSLVLGVRCFAEWRLRCLLRGAVRDAQAEDDRAGRLPTR